MSLIDLSKYDDSNDIMTFIDSGSTLCANNVSLSHITNSFRADYIIAGQIHREIASDAYDSKQAHRTSSLVARYTDKNKASLRHSMKLQRNKNPDRQSTDESHSDSEKSSADRTSSLTTSHKSLSESRSGLSGKTRNSFRRSIRRTASKLASRTQNSPQCDAMILASQHTLNHDPQMISVNEAILDLFQRKERPPTDHIHTHHSIRGKNQREAKSNGIAENQEYDFGNSQIDFNNLTSLRDSGFLDSSMCELDSTLSITTLQSPVKTASSESNDFCNSSSSVLGGKLCFGRKHSRVTNSLEEKSISSGLNKIWDSGRKLKTIGRLDSDSVNSRERLDASIRCVTSLEKRYDTMCIVENLHRTLVKGMIVLRQQLIDLQGSEFVSELQAIWSWFYSRTINDISAIFCTRESLLMPYIRPLCLSEFRDHIMVHHHVRTTLMEQIKTIEERFLPREISQMLHVLASRCYADPLDSVSRKIIRKLLSSMVQNTDNDCRHFIARLRKFVKDESGSLTQVPSDYHEAADLELSGDIMMASVPVDDNTTLQIPITAGEESSSDAELSADCSHETNLYQFPLRNAAQDAQREWVSDTAYITDSRASNATTGWAGTCKAMSRSFDHAFGEPENQNKDTVRITKSLPVYRKGTINMGLAIQRALTGSSDTLAGITDFASPQQAETDSQPWRSPVQTDSSEDTKAVDSTTPLDTKGGVRKPSSRRSRASSVLEVGGRMMRMRKKSSQGINSQEQKCHNGAEKSRQDKKSKQYEHVMNVAAAEHFQHQEKNKAHGRRNRSATLASAASTSLRKTLSRELGSSQTSSTEGEEEEEDDDVPLFPKLGRGRNRANTRDTYIKPKAPNFVAGKVSGLGFRRFSVIRDESRSQLLDSDSELSTCSGLNSVGDVSSGSPTNDDEQPRKDIECEYELSASTFSSQRNESCEQFTAISNFNENQLYSQRAGIHATGGQ